MANSCEIGGEMIFMHNETGTIHEAFYFNCSYIDLVAQNRLIWNRFQLSEFQNDFTFIGFL